MNIEKLRTNLAAIVPVPLKKNLVKLLSGRGNTLSYLLYGAATYNYDGLVTAHNADFMSDPKFAAAYAAGKATGSWAGELYWRAYTICWAADYASRLAGDFVECGVNRGGYALTAIKYTGFAEMDKRFYLLDTFKGLDEAYISAAEKEAGIVAKRWGYADCYDEVVATFSPYSNVRIIQGTVPDTLPQVDSEQIAFLSIDMNNREPEIAAATYFWDKLVSGAVIVLDDYGWRKHIEQKRAFDEFAAERDVSILSLPTGQGLLYKP